MIKVQAAGVGNVAITDRRGVVEFLLGESEGTGRVMPNIDDGGELYQSPSRERVFPQENRFGSFRG